MAAQDYRTHAHNPKLTTIGFLFILLALVAFGLRWFGIGGRFTFALGLLGLIAANTVLLLISRTYTTRLQDRIIKLEMKLRCAPLLTPAQQLMYARLDKPQIIALRFASDAELPSLLERAHRERLSADQIKRAITDWVADWDRT
jgi:hypothetical protein